MNIEKLRNLVFDYYDKKSKEASLLDRGVFVILTRLEKQQMEDEDTIQRFEALVARMEDFENK